METRSASAKCKIFAERAQRLFISGKIWYNIILNRCETCSAAAELAANMITEETL